VGADAQGNSQSLPRGDRSSGEPLRTENRELRTAASNFAGDQKWFWTSPFRIRENDLPWLLPIAAGTVVAVASDTAIEKHLPSSKSFIDRSKTFSDAGVAAFAAGSAGMYLFPRFWPRAESQEPRAKLRETGLLSAEAGVDSLVATEVLKFAAGRERPTQGNGRGDWFQGGGSFPSEHSAAAWSMATVIGGRYPGWMTQLLAYGGAAAVSAARVTSREHFASDALIGSALGWYIGHHVLNRAAPGPPPSIFGQFDKTAIGNCVDTENHPEPCPDPLPSPDHALGASERGARSPDTQGSGGRRSVSEGRDPGTIGSPYVPIDSWVYPAFDRLIAQGYIKSAFLGLRPWTRMSCARLLAEAGGEIEGNSAAPHEIAQVYRELEREFAVEEREQNGRAVTSIALESVYTRLMDISGTPVNDSYHFGQTIINDFGRPYQSGFNNVTGFTSRGQAGRFAFYVNGEYQYAPSAHAYPLSVRQVIANVDDNPLRPATPIATTDQFRLLDTYVSANLSGLTFSVGKQTLWWGPTQSGPMIMSNNAEPLWMLRLNRADPLWVPGLSKLLGPIRLDNFYGKLEGHSYPPAPYFYGQKVSFKPTENLEFGFSRDAVFGGEGHTPVTLGTFLNSFFSTSSVSSTQKTSRNDPGARHTGFDFSYRFPGLRKWITLYTDSAVHDALTPLDWWSRGKNISLPYAAINPGIYISHFPNISKLDFRMEAVMTDIPRSGFPPGQFIYWEQVYHDAYLNNGNLMGNWIGRDGKGYQAWSTYRLSPKSSFQVAYRNAKVSKDFIPGGTTQNDFYAKVALQVRRNLGVQIFVQYETWLIPVLAPNRKSDITSYLQLTFWPNAVIRREP
jgi:hypothetical protein